MRGLDVESGSGHVESLLEANNENDVRLDGVEIGTFEDGSGSFPSVAEVLAPTSTTVNYHNGNGWQDATVQYYDGTQFLEVPVNQI